jgi:hypothetical protein
MTDLPEGKRSRRELEEIRMRNALASRQLLLGVANTPLHPLVLTIGYVSCMAGATLALAGMVRSGLVAAMAGMLLSLFIFCKKPVARHHAAVFLIISLLVLVFGTVYELKQFEQTADDAQGPTGY